MFARIFSHIFSHVFSWLRDCASTSTFACLWHNRHVSHVLKQLKSCRIISAASVLQCCCTVCARSACCPSVCTVVLCVWCLCELYSKYPVLQSMMDLEDTHTHTHTHSDSGQVSGGWFKSLAQRKSVEEGKRQWWCNLREAGGRGKQRETLHWLECDLLYCCNYFVHITLSYRWLLYLQYYSVYIWFILLYFIFNRIQAS